MSAIALPPHSADAEHSVLGGLLLSPAAYDRLENLQPEHFYIEAHRLIFAAAQGLLANGGGLDVVTLDAALAARGQSQRVGGLAYLAELAASTPGAANIGRHARIIRDKAIERQLLVAADEVDGIVRGCGQTADKLAQAQAAIMRITETAAAKQARLVGEGLAAKLVELEERAAGKRVGYRTGWAGFDAEVHLMPTDLVVVAGRPSMGKTAFAIDMAKQFALDGLPVGVFSMEMSESQLTDRLLASLGRASLKDILAGRCSEGVVAAFGRVRDLPFAVDETAGMTVHELVARARSMIRRFGIKVLVIDYLQLIITPGVNRVSELGEITRTLKIFAKDNGVLVILLSQLSRKVEERTDKRPMMSDLRESGAIEQDADSILLLYREEYYQPDTPKRGVAEVVVAKQRQGQTGIVSMAFFGEQQRFESLDRGYSSPSSASEEAPSRKGFE